jgi:hypothetical protein
MAYGRQISLLYTVSHEANQAIGQSHHAVRVYIDNHPDPLSFGADKDHLFSFSH